MDLPAKNTVVFEENRTRGDLYRLWLDDYDVEVATTKQQADEVLSGSTVVAVLNQGFADGDARKLLKIIRSRAPLCRVIETRDQSATFPELAVDHHLDKPVFEEDLIGLVETLLARANYHFALSLYYQTNVDLSSFEISDESETIADQEYDVLQERATQLQQLIAGLTNEMTKEDIVAVKREILLDRDIEEKETKEKIDSKYRPSGCTNCDQSWKTAPGEQEKVTQLGAYVWRCINCGHIQMAADPSHQHVNRM